MASMRRFMLASLLFVAGCTGFGEPTSMNPGLPPGAAPNPIFIPATDREFLWNQTVDALDDYFRIEREERVQLVGEVLTEGRIDTIPTVGSTYLEPWRHDSVPGFERLHSTLQSTRRRAVVRVTPTQGGYLVEVAVFKELEEVARPEFSNFGEVPLRNDSALVRRERSQFGRAATLGWIPMGRDILLEQRILGDLRARLAIPSV